jgi:hypothetical protein
VPLNAFANNTLTSVWHIVAVQYNATNAAIDDVPAESLTMTVRRQDDTQETVANNPETAGENLNGTIGLHRVATIGGRLNGTTQDRMIDGQLAEFLYYNRALSSTEVDTVLDYLSSKYFDGTMPLFGDYNDDGAVNAADYVTWREATQSMTPLKNENLAITPGLATIEDYNIWRANFGLTTAEAGTGFGGSQAVPEPLAASLVLLGVFVTMPVVGVRRRNRH